MSPRLDTGRDILISACPTYHLPVPSSGACVIGLSSYHEVAVWGAWNTAADLLPTAYSDAVRAVGAVPMLLPPGSPDPVSEAVTVVRALDGLILTGGSDVDPRRYGAEPGPATDQPRVDRDEWELALIRAAVEVGRPLLAICRGLQVLNVALGGTLIQHLPDVVGNETHRGPLGAYVDHSVRLGSDTLLSRLYGTTVDVPTHHHQAIDHLAPGLVATAWAGDGTIEAVTAHSSRWINGVQWHPEVRGGQALFAEFVAECQRAR